MSLKSLYPVFWVVQNRQKAQKCQIWSTNTILFLWKSEINSETFQRLSSVFWVTDSFVSKFLKILHRILWLIEYLFNIQKRQILSADAKMLFWKTEANLETFLKLSLFPRVTDNFVSRFIKSLNRMCWMIRKRFSAQKCQIWSMNTKLFSEKAILGLPINMFCSFSKD